MQALYTMLFKDYLDRGGTIPPQIDNFKPFTLGGLNLNMKDLFIERNELKEIGAETEALFYHLMNDTINEALIKYNNKIEMYIDKFNILMERTVEENGSSKNANYLNPINSNTNGDNAPKINDLSTSEYKATKTFGYFKSNPEILKEVLMLEDIYNDALAFMDRCFLGII